LDRDYKTERSTEHRAKFRADRPTELGDYAAKKRKKTTAKQKSFRKLLFSGGLIKARCRPTSCSPLSSNRQHYTACAIAESCCISDVPSQWESQKFDPPLIPHFQPIFLKLKTKKNIRDTTLRSKFGWCGTTRRGCAKMANFCLLLVLSFFVLFASRPDHIVGPITTNEGSKRVFLRKEVPFWGLDDKK